MLSIKTDTGTKSCVKPIVIFVIQIILKIKQILYKDKKLKEEIEKNLGVKIADDAELGNFVEIDKETINLNEYK